MCRLRPAPPLQPASLRPRAPLPWRRSNRLIGASLRTTRAGQPLDGQALLVSAFDGFVDELNRAGLDTPAAELPPLRGDRAQDWAAFSSAYQDAEAQLGAGGALRQELAQATLKAMVASLHDDHAS